MNEYWSLVVLVAAWIIMAISAVVGFISLVALVTSFCEGDDYTLFCGVLFTVCVIVVVLSGCYINVYGP